jgi:FMN-dependent NADH-azoreductase
VRAGKTFSYTGEGPQGHAGGRKAIAVIASAGMYAGTPMEAYDHEIPYLQQILGFFGITNVEFIRACGTNDVAQGKISAQEYLASYLEKAKLAV